MKQILEFIPLIIFFVLYKTYDIYTATGALIIATAIQMIVIYLLYKKIEKMQLFTFFLVTIFGGMTLIFHNDSFIKWKVTIIYALFALGLLITHFIGKPLIKGMLGKEIQLPDDAWTKINHAWVIFFIICALLNIYVAFSMPLDTWVNFKVFGLTAATLIFTILNGVYIYKRMPKETEQTPEAQQETNTNSDKNDEIQR